MTQKILFVDDDPNLLAGIERQLRKRYTLDTAPSGRDGLEALAHRGPFAVVVSDLRMPGMDGIEFLTRVRKEFPDPIRILLTGTPEIRQAIEVVNSGGIFRFLTKPTPPDTLTNALDVALEQYRLVMAERELLDQTLRGSVQVLGEILELVNPTEFGRAIRVQRLIRELAKFVPGADAWEIDVAAVLSQLGSIAISKDLLAASNLGSRLAEEERHQLEAAPRVAKELLRPIPRLERVTEIVSCYNCRFTDVIQPGSRSGKAIPLGARLLKLAFDFDALLARDVSKPEAFVQLRSRVGWYDPDLVNSLELMIGRQLAPEVREIPVGQIQSGMILGQNLYSDNGRLLLKEGHIITEPIRHRLEAFAMMGQFSAAIRVLIPADFN